MRSVAVVNATVTNTVKNNLKALTMTVCMICACAILSHIGVILDFCILLKSSDKESSLYMSRAFMAGAASQAGDADSSRAPGLTSGLQGSVNVHRGALLLVPQWQCISSFVFYSKDSEIWSYQFPCKNRKHAMSKNTLWATCEKKEEIWLSPMTKVHILTDMSKGQSDDTTPKKFDNTAIADRLRTVSWSNYRHLTGLVYRFDRAHLPTHLWIKSAKQRRCPKSLHRTQKYH